MKKRTKILTAILAAVLVLAIAGAYYLKTNFLLWNGMLLRRDAQVIILEGKPLEDDLAELNALTRLQTLDARGCTDYDKLMEAVQLYPELEVLYTVAVDGVEYPQDAREVVLSSVTEENLALLAYLPELTQVDGSGCADYVGLWELQQRNPQYHVTYFVPLGEGAVSADAEVIAITGTEAAELVEKLAYLPNLRGIDGSDCVDYQSLALLKTTYPECNVTYSVALGEEEISSDAENVGLYGVEVAQLQDNLVYLPELRQVHLENPVCTGGQLRTLTESYPDVAFTWEMDVFGIRVTSADKEVDLSGVQIPSLEAVEQAMDCFPAVELLYLGEQDIENAVMAEFREKMRPEYKVAWMMTIGFVKTRSDATTFFPKYQGLTEEWSEDLKYCEDMVCVDVGHKPILTVKWAAYMPHLRYLIIADTSVRDLSPLSGLKELVYLEAFQSPVKDYSPLLGCTALEDLNISNTHADKEPLLQMTWLKRLWWAGVGAPLHEFREALPNTELMFGPDPSMGYGWRLGYLYFEMRDMLGAPYMDA